MINLSPDWLAWQLRERKKIGALDAPDVRDWEPEQLFGSVENFPEPIVETGKDVDLRNMMSAYDQEDSQSCTSQGTTGSTETMVKRGEDFDKIQDNVLDNLDGKPFELWKDQFISYEKTMGSASESQGDYLQNALKTAKARGIPMLIGTKMCIVHIKGYAKIKNSEVCAWLERGHPVFTGSKWILGRNGNRYLPYDKDGFLFEASQGRDIGGHAWFILGKKTDISGKVTYKMQNSHGGRWGAKKDGMAKFTEQKLVECFSKYILHIDWKDLYAQIENPAYAQAEVDRYYKERADTQPNG